MAKRTLIKFFEGFSIPLTLRWRLTLWTAGLLLFLGLGLTVFTNVVAAIRVPQVLIAPTELPAISQNPSNQEPGTEQAVNAPSIDQLQRIVIQEVRLITLSGILLFSVLGAIGAYRIACISIQPLQHLNQLMSNIKPKSLGQRLHLEGPEDEIKHLANTFDEMLDRLERAFEQQGRFVADAAHELRTPLANMRTNLEVTQLDPNATEEDYHNLTQTFDCSLERLENLVEDLLLLAKAEKASQEESTTLEHLLKKVVQESEELSLKHQVEVKLISEGNHTITGDGPMLTIAFRNIIRNGIQYNYPGGKVTINVQADANWTLVTIADTGVGIPESDLPHIFERFYRVDKSRAQNLGGAGLGLSIASHIVELHGGSIDVESELGAGSCFTVFLPNQVIKPLS